MSATDNAQVAILKMLYAQHPKKAGDCFVEVRLWETVEGDRVELIAEYGQMDDDGDLVTRCLVMPFFMTMGEVLQVIGR